MFSRREFILNTGYQLLVLRCSRGIYDRPRLKALKQESVDGGQCAKTRRRHRKKRKTRSLMSYAEVLTDNQVYGSYLITFQNSFF